MFQLRSLVRNYIWVVGLGIELLNLEDCDVLREETRSMSNLGIMGEQLCQSCSNHLVYCWEPVKFNHRY